MKTTLKFLFVASPLLLATLGFAAPSSLLSTSESSLPPSITGAGSSHLPILSPDGRYVLFASTANNLVTNASGKAFQFSGTPKFNIYRRDRLTQTTVLLSINQSGTGGGNGDSWPTAISGNGRYALFESSAPDLVALDTNNAADVFLRDAWGNVTYLVSVNLSGMAGNGLSRGSTLTPDGRYIAFTSLATNLVTGDTNGTPDVFVRDMQTSTTVLATPGSKGVGTYNPIGSESPDLSGDGRVVAFYSMATNVVPGVTNRGEIYLRDLVTSNTVWVSALAHSLLGSNAVSFNHVLSTNGDYLAFAACSNAPLFSVGAQSIILRYNLSSGVTDTIDDTAATPAANPEEFHNLAMTPDGQYISYVARNDPLPSTNIGTHIRRWDALSHTSLPVSTNLSGGLTADATCHWPIMDDGGRWIAYLSSAQDLVTNGLSGDFQIFLTDVETGITSLVNADNNQQGSGVGPQAAPQLSSDGSHIAFEAFASSLVAGDFNGSADVFIRASLSSVNDLVSARETTLPEKSAAGSSLLNPFATSTDGNRLVFASDAWNLVSSDTNGLRDVFVRDLFGGSNVLVSANTNGGVANGISSEPAISTDGRYVVFTSDATDLVANDTNNVADVFRRDLVSGELQLVSSSSDGTGHGNEFSSLASISTGGRFVVFRSRAKNLADGSYSVGSVDNLFVRDMQLGITTALTTNGVKSASTTPDGRFIAYAGATGNQVYVWDTLAGNTTSTYTVANGITTLSISPDGNKIVCLGSTPRQVVLIDRIANTNGPITSTLNTSVQIVANRLGFRFSADSTLLAYSVSPANLISNQVYLYDFHLRTQILISAAAGTGANASGNSDSPDISADGRFIVYRSAATNIVALTDSNSTPNIFLYDRLTKTTSILSSQNTDHGPANSRSRMPAFSPDGRTLFFQSWADNLSPGDFNQGSDVFTLPLLYATIATGTSSNGYRLISWPNRPSESYQVQYRDDLNGAWQNLGATIGFSGNRASVTDVASTATNRFYRVMTY